jgi:alpha-tubulin suppressor-like RCC1 family protein
MNNPEPHTSPVTRRAIVGAAAWTAPAIVMAVASPAAAASSPVSPEKPTVDFTKLPLPAMPGGVFDDVVIAATTDGVTPAPVGDLITVTLSGGLTFADGSTTKDFAASGSLDSVTASGILAGTVKPETGSLIQAIYGEAQKTAVLNVGAAELRAGNVFGWGYNAAGAAGYSGTATRPLTWQTAEKFTSVYGGYAHFAAVTTAGTVYMTGSNASGPFGKLTPSTSGATGPIGPALNESLTAPFTIAARTSDTQAMYDQTTWIWGTDGKIYACGENSSDMFSLDDGTADGVADNPKGGLKPVGLQILAANPGKSIIWASGNGWYRAAYLLNDGTVWNSGSNNFGGMGSGGVVGKQYLAAQTITSNGSPLTDIVQVRVTQDTTLYLDSEGKLWGAGQPRYSQLPGLSNVANTRALPVTQPGGKKVDRIWANSSDFESFFARTTDGVIYTAGNNTSGSSSVGHADRVSVWTPISLPAGKTLADIGGGGDGNLFLMTDGTVYFAGSNDTGGLGTGVTAGKTTVMTQVPLPRRAIAVAATFMDTYAAILAD